MRITLFGMIVWISYGNIDIFAEEPTVETIVQMWSERQAATKTAMFHWGESGIGEQAQPDGDEGKKPARSMIT